MFEAVHNISVETKYLVELDKEAKLRFALYSKSSTPYNTCKIPSLHHINDVDKEFDFIYSKLRGAIAIFNYLKSDMNTMFDAYIR